MSVLHKGSPVRVAEGALHKQPKLIGKDGRVAKLPVHPCTWIVVEFPDLGPETQCTFRSSALTPLDKNGEPLPGWANRYEHSSYTRPLKKPKAAGVDAFDGAVLGRRARESNNFNSDYVSIEPKARKRSAPGSGFRRKEPKRPVVSDDGALQVDWSGMQAFDSPPGTEFLKLAEVAYALALPPSLPVRVPEDALDAQLCLASGLCSGCGTSLWKSSGGAMFCWNTTCRASPINDFKGPCIRATPVFMTPSDGTGTRYSVEDANDVSFAVSAAPPPFALVAPRAPAPSPVLPPTETLPAAVSTESHQSAVLEKSPNKGFTSVASKSMVQAEFAVPQELPSLPAHQPQQQQQQQQQWHRAGSEVRFPTARSVSPLAVSSGGAFLQVDTTDVDVSSTSFLVSPHSTDHDKTQKAKYFFCSSSSASPEHDLDSEVQAVLQNSNLDKLGMQSGFADETDDPFGAAKRRSVQVLSPATLPEEEDSKALDISSSQRSRIVS